MWDLSEVLLLISFTSFLWCTHSLLEGDGFESTGSHWGINIAFSLCFLAEWAFRECLQWYRAVCELSAACFPRRGIRCACWKFSMTAEEEITKLVAVLSAPQVMWCSWKAGNDTTELWEHAGCNRIGEGGNASFQLIIITSSAFCIMEYWTVVIF